MKKRWIVMSAVLAGFLLFIGTARASWVYMFVVFNGSAYAISDSRIAPDRIGAKLGIVTSYSDHEEEAHSGNFSNRYPKGTPYYRIQGIEINQAIAVNEAEGVFVKAEYRGVYAGGKYRWGDIWLCAGPAVSLLAMILFLRARRKY